jgi:AcrR family transcriptional regulator
VNIDQADQAMTTLDEQPAPSPKSENTISRILDAALDIFARKGYHDTRMDEIVAGSQTSKGSIYFHFPNKEQLFLALVDQFANLLERRITEAISEHDRGMVKVQAALEACLATFGRYRRQAKVVLVQASGLGNTFEQKRLAINDRFAALIALYLQEAVDVGEIAPLDTEVVAQAWMGAIYNLVIRWVYTGEPDSERILQALVPMLLQSVGYQPEQHEQVPEEQA